MNVVFKNGNNNLISEPKAKCFKCKTTTYYNKITEDQRKEQQSKPNQIFFIPCKKCGNEIEIEY